MGSASEIANRAAVVHIDIDPAEIGKNIKPHLPIQADIRLVLEEMSKETVPSHDVRRDWLQTAAI